MMDFFSNLEQHARSQPDQRAMVGSTGTLSYLQLVQQINWMCQELKDKGVRRLAILADNSPEWAVMDLAACKLGIPCIPLPSFFSATQLSHCLNDCQPDLIVTDQPNRISTLSEQFYTAIPFYGLHALTALRLISQPSTQALPPQTCKITYTSGTTGEPKGVCLSAAAIESVTNALADTSAGTHHDRHLSILPLSTLLENIAGLYTPLKLGATVYLLSKEKLDPASPQTLIHQIHDQCIKDHISTLLLTPQLLQLWCLHLRQPDTPPTVSSLRYIAVGGASVPLTLLKQAAQHALPVYEGYGLSECASVVSVNPLQHAKPGSVGKVLPHLTIKIAGDGEILIKGTHFLGYLGMPPNQDSWWPTGDLGRLDEDGYLFLQGRKKNLFITSQGRNISPEWIEQILSCEPEISQVAVFGEGLPQPVAIIFPSPLARTAEDSLSSAIQRANQKLPKYAQLMEWTVSTEPFSSQNGLLTANGRLKRDSLLARFQAQFSRRLHSTPCPAQPA